MSHKTLLDGTGYEIGGGKTLIDATEYEIGGGKTLVNGTGYEIKFISQVTLTIRGGGLYYAKVTHNGTIYNTATIITVNIGDVITLYVNKEFTMDDAYIEINGVKESVSGYKGNLTKMYTITGNTVVTLSYTAGNYRAGRIVLVG